MNRAKGMGMKMEFSNCWLQYQRLSNLNQTELELFIIVQGNGLKRRAFFQPEKITECDSHLIFEQPDGMGVIMKSIVEELTYAFETLYGRKIRCVSSENTFRSGILLIIDKSMQIGKEGYHIECADGTCIISARSEAGLLYGTFSLLRNLQVQQVTNFDDWTCREEKEPYNPLRMLNHWDNLDGSIERGYSGKSFFFNENEVLINERTKAYARMIASVGINAVVINNVNVKGAATELISERYYEKLQGMMDCFDAFGIKLYLSINFAAPIELSDLNTSDPCDEKVRSWWVDKSKEIWRYLPKLGGFLVKADSEGRPGPFTYGRTHADGANMLAKAVEPFEGLIIWRCFVYNCQQNWRDRKTDRARAGYDNFMPLDGLFADNVILQIKNGPMDFQVREPLSPLFGGLTNTNMMLEVQIAQEYTGQQRHVCYLIPWFKQILNFNTYCSDKNGRIADIISGRTYNNANCGIAAVANTGNDFNWTGHDFAAANLYGFGRLAFDMELSSEDIANEWILQTFGSKEKVKENILKILIMSWPAYEKYTSPLGIGWMVKPNIHYGPDVDGYEYDRWGTYHRADHKGIGVDRTAKGTGYCSQYKEPLASIYSDKATCPEELLLFFHHVEYEYILSTGKTVLQHIYDTHFEGANEVEQFLDLWKELQGLLMEDIYQRTLQRLIHQKEHAREWCDVINSYFYRKTGIADQNGRSIY